MVDIGTIYVEFDDVRIDDKSDAVALRATFYYGGNKWSNSIKIPIADLDVVRAVEDENDVVFHGVNDGEFFFVDADHYDHNSDELLDFEHVTRVPVPDGLLPDE